MPLPALVLYSPLTVSLDVAALVPILHCPLRSVRSTHSRSILLSLPLLHLILAAT